MTGNPNSQVWLTSALTESDVPKALTLCFSLKRVLTCRKVGVITSRQLPSHLIEPLRQGFEYLFFLEDGRNSAGVKEQDFIKLFPLTLKPFEMCVFLSPTMLAVQNCDKIFDECCSQRFSGYLLTEGTGMDVFVIKPSPKVFENLMNGLVETNGLGTENYIRAWVDTNNEACKLLTSNYNLILSAQSLPQSGNEKDVLIVNTRNLCLDMNTDELGLFTKLILKQWNLVYMENVLPLLKDPLSTADPLISQGSFNKEPIAIVGMSCRYPGANNLEEFWNLLLNKKDGTRTPPDYRWLRELTPFYQNDYRTTNAGFLQTPVEEFDAKFFGISPSEMGYLDPQHRLLLQLVWEALEDAAVDPKRLSGTNAGVFLGTWTNDYKDILTLSGDDHYFRKYMGNSIGAAAARISHFLEITGPSIATESGCSASMMAVHLACKSLQLRETNFSFACGVNLCLRPFGKEMMPAVLSEDGLCKTFDEKADGFARAEGCGVLVLKRLSDAVRDGDRIWALIRGSGVSQEGLSKSMGTPTVHSESLAMEMALRDAQIQPEQVSYVETHGTGTPVGDPMEVASIAKAYHSKFRKEPLLIGSVKTNVGHTESVSGIAGIMKVVVAMQHQIIPPHRKLEKLNPAIDLDAVPAKIPLEPVAWPKLQGKSRFAGVSSFGITGTDTHAILEEAPEVNSNAFFNSSGFERPMHIMKLSAKTKEAINLLIENYGAHFNTDKDKQDMKDLCYTANTGRADFGHRAIILASSKEEASKLIAKNILLRGEKGSDDPGKICFLFTGQGSQYPGMAKQLYQTSPVFRMHFEFCEKILRKQYNLDIAQILWSESKSSEVSRTIYSQTSIFCVEYALLKLWESWGVKADYALGHSLGEFAAAVCAEILTVEDAIKLVAERSRLIDQLPRGKMLVIKADKTKVDTILSKFAGNDKSRELDYAAINSSEQTVVAGDSDLVLEFSETCKQSGLKCIVLEATHAFHSKHMDPMLNDYRKVAQSVNKMGGNWCKYISGVKGKLVDGEEVNAEYWVEHTREKVLFMKASKKAVELGCTTFIEIGPQPVLSALTMMNNDTELLCLPSLKRNENEWETLLNTLGKLYVKGYDINWNGFDAFYERKKISLPHYPFIGKKYWPDVQSSLSTTIHPLLGSVIPNASTTKLFQCDFSLKRLEYINDHVIGDTIVFPGAGYLEMCLAAGYASIQGSTDTLPPPTFPMKVENLIIEAPLQLQDSKLCQVQTTLDLNTNEENQEYTVKIFQRLESESGKWIPHVTACYSPLPTPEQKQVPFDKNAFKETLSSRVRNEEYPARFYDKFATTGLKFGPIFKSLEAVWKDEDTTKLVIKVKLPQDRKDYIVHPVILDAMIQSIILLQGESGFKKKLFVPVKIGKFVWLSSTDCSEIYIHAFKSRPNDEGNAVLVDEQGHVLAVMSSVEYIDTTVKAIEAVLEQQSSSMPDMWEEVWGKEVGLLEDAVDWEKVTGKFYTSDFFHQIETIYNQPPTQLAETFSLLEKHAYLYILKTIYRCGWKPEVFQEFVEDDLFLELKIQTMHRKYFTFMLNVLEKEGILQKMDGVTWKVVRIPPCLEKVKTQLNSPEFTSNLVERFRSTLLLSKFGENLAEILRGEQSALSILFPEQKEGYLSVADFYNDYGEVFKQTESSIKILRQRVSHIRKKLDGKRFVMRILEAGAGTGSYTSGFLHFLEEEGIEFEYTYTDISASFFPAAEKRFEKYGKRMKFQKLNLEEDPINQGFIPEYFDFVFMSEVIHATRDIKESLRNIRVLMKPFAVLTMLDGIGVHRFITFLFGSLEGFWRFTDFDLRPNHCTLSTKEWDNVLNTSGFNVDGIFPILNNHHANIYACKTATDPLTICAKQKSSKIWLVFHDSTSTSPISNFLVKKIRETTTRKVFIVTASDAFEENGETFSIRKFKEEDYIKVLNVIETQGLTLEGILYCWALDQRLVSQDEILQPFFYLAKAIITSEYRNSPRLIAFTNGGGVPLNANDLAHFHTSTLLGFTKSLKNEYVDLDCRCIEIAIDSQDHERKMQEVFFEIWRCEKDADTMVAFHDNSRYFPKLQPLKPSHITSKLLSLPKGANRFQLILPETKLISDLQFGLLDTSDVLMDDELEVQVKASALNFRDVLCVIKPTDRFKDMNGVGLDIAGVVKRVGKKVTKWEVGDRVSGCIFKNMALPSHLVCTDDQLMRIPDNMSFCEASTISAVYSTSIVGLLEVAKIKKEDAVLIHSATGGVGLSAIEICKHVGCTIIATAGSNRKQNYLRGLGIKHIFNSRNTDYSNQIMMATNGRGVDVVLNSLTSEGFKEATLKACAPGARFVEMSKMNVWTIEEVKEIRPDIEYTIIDITQTPRKEWSELLLKTCELQEKNVVQPIPYVRFDALNIRDALEYLQKAKHIGKIVCVMPEFRKKGGEVTVVTPMFNERSTYLITGGLGGIGFVTCQWMVKNGAKHVLLAGRSLPSPSIQQKINEMNSDGVCIVPVNLDVGNFQQCKDLIEIQIPTMNLPPLKGVIHSAGTLADGLIINQDWEKLSSTFKAKIDGTLNLHKLTTSMNLEHFVLFSSMAAIFGPPGQCNHTAANAFEDAFTHYRNSIGLPASTINWGPWSEVGAATEIEIPGVKAISNRQGMSALEFALKTHRIQTAVFGVSSFVLFRRMWPHQSFRKYLDERVWNKSASTLVTGGKESMFWDEYDTASNKIEVMRSHVRHTLRYILKLDENDVFGDDVDMKDLGMDSLMFVEIKNRLQTLFGARLSIAASSIRDSNTVSLLATTLIGLIEGKNVIETQKPTIEEVTALIREDCKLPEYIRAQLNQTVESVKNVKKVLLTGSTGNFGPYVLKELTNLTQITQVICLMRHSTREPAEERLNKVLNKLELLPNVDMRKVKCISGNLAESHLGMEANEWEYLSQNVDAVFHCAALVKHVGYYRKTGSDMDMRAVNIGGTKNVLEFACKNKLKHVYHASSILAVSTLDENGRISEKWPEVEDFDGATAMGYPVTKFVEDVLMKQAVERGIPCKVFRFPLISGESVTGRCNIENNHTLLRYLFVLKTGIMPSVPFVIPVLPVDICAKVSLQIFCNETAQPDLYNIIPAFPNADQKFVEIAKEFGYSVDVVEFSRFAKRVLESGGEASALETFKELYSDEDEVLKVTGRSPVLGVGKEEGEHELRNKWSSQKVAKLIPNFSEDQKQSMDYVRQDLLFCKSQGWFKQFGL